MLLSFLLEIELKDFLCIPYYFIYFLLIFIFYFLPIESIFYTFCLIVFYVDFLELLCCLFDKVFDLDLDFYNVCIVQCFEGFVYIYNNGLGDIYLYDCKLYFLICFIKSSMLLYVCLWDFLDNCFCIFFIIFCTIYFISQLLTFIFILFYYYFIYFL